MYQRILVATDGSALSKKAVRSSIELAAATDAELVALYVVPRYPVSYFEGGITISEADIARTEKQWAERGQAVVDKVRADAEAQDVKAKAVVVRSDLVVMASHGRKGIKRILLGSETQHVLTHSSLPVLVLR